MAKNCPHSTPEEDFKQRSKVPPALNQFTKTLDKNLDRTMVDACLTEGAHYQDLVQLMRV
ncbi:hypothetical protein C5167_025951 [Papaver somniferum]|uniref:Uncharacterized protein n=1 Tax=Papaver somniferum TaxID=3469 RepID=A0A4Y7JW54_PAPSO|nr:hypothetical protein C5167_025951 [Papaver somniferum]